MSRMRTTAAIVALALGPLAPGLGAQHVALGLKGGLNLSDASSDQFELQGLSSRKAFVGGGFLTVTGGKSIAFQSELLYSQQGFGMRVVGGTARVSLDYLEIPILLRVRLVPEDRKIRPAVFAGGFVSFESGCSIKGAGGDCETLLAGRGESDAGLVFGGGADIGLAGRYFLALDGRYNVGLANLVWEEETDRVSSRVWAFTAGLGILLGR